jgi:DNA polymerase III epsilon subunit family exonuclease
VPDLEKTLSSLPIAVVDVETTGTSPRFGHRITELAIQRIENGQVVHTFSQLINPQRPLPPHITALTGITPEMLADQPTFAQIAPEAAQIFDGALILGHNVTFDLSFLRAEFTLAEVHPSFLTELTILDTLRIARRRLGPRGNGLQRLAGRLGISPPTAHRALADVQTTLAVFEKLIAPEGYSLTLDQLLQLQSAKRLASQIRHLTDLDSQTQDLPATD